MARDPDVTVDKPEPALEGFFGRTLESLRRALRGYDQIGPVKPDLPPSDAGWLREHIDACLEGRGGEVSARARAAELGRTFIALSETGRRRFLTILAEEYVIDRQALDAAITAWQHATGTDQKRQAERRLRAALVPPRVKLLTQFNALPQGVKFLVDMRAELLPHARKDPALKMLDDDLRELLASWFDIGFLDLKRITWQSPAALLEKLIAYEAVHEIRSWDDLKNRLDSDRRCFAFFHPRMPDEPLIFVEVALVRGMAGNVQELLDEHAPRADPGDADAAIFYSISNAQAGLAGVSFGNFLIKRVADNLAHEFPNLRTFATLSPVPAFRDWINETLDGNDAPLFEAAEARQLVDAAGLQPAGAALRALLSRPDWYRDERIVAALKPVLTRLCAHYLLEAKRGRQARDRVAHFHLWNGARLERINWLADRSANGLRQSAGMMVNYLYKLADVEKNHEAYAEDGRIAASAAVRRLLKS